MVHVPDPEHAWKSSDTQRWEARRAKGLQRSIPPQVRNNPQLRAKFAGPFTLLRTQVPAGWLVRFGPNRVRYVPDERGGWK